MPLDESPEQRPDSDAPDASPGASPQTATDSPAAADSDEAELLLPPPRELPLPYFIDGDIVGIVGQNKRLRFAWVFLMGGPVAAVMSQVSLGRIAVVPVAATGLACLAVFFLAMVSLWAGYDPAKSSPILLNRRTKKVFLGRYDEGGERMHYYSLPYSALRFSDALGGLGSTTLNVTVSEEGREPWTLTKFGRLIDKKDTGSISYLLELFMAGHDVIKPSRKAADEYAAEVKKRPPLPPEAGEFVKE